MAIYFMFIQHIVFSLKPNGKAAIVVPTGFITAQSGIGKKIRQKLVEEKMLSGVVTMPSNIFATTGTNVSVLFVDKENNEDIVLIDASSLGETIKEDGNQKTVLTHEEEERIIKTFTAKEVVEDFSVVVSYDELEAKNYSMSAGQYFEIKIQHVDITKEEFQNKIKDIENNLSQFFHTSKDLQVEIKTNLEKLKHEG